MEPRITSYNVCYTKLLRKVYEVAKSANPNKHERSDNFGAICDEYIAEYYPEGGEVEAPISLIKRYYHDSYNFV